MNHTIILLRKMKFRLFALAPWARRSRQEWKPRAFTMPDGERAYMDRHYPGLYDQTKEEYEVCCADPAWRVLAQKREEITPDLIKSLEAQGEKAEALRLISERYSFRRAMDAIQLRIFKRPSPTRKDAA